MSRSVTALALIGQIRNSYTIVYAPVLLDFSLSVKAAPHECVIRTSQL